MTEEIKKQLDKCFTLNKKERILRIIQLSVKEDVSFLTMEEMAELACLQTIRSVNGEFDEIEGTSSPMKGRLN